jgi:hypothetical protein
MPEGRAQQYLLVRFACRAAPFASLGCACGRKDLGESVHDGWPVNPRRRDTAIPNRTTAPVGATISLSLLSVSSRSIQWKDRPIATRSKCPNEPSRSCEDARTASIEASAAVARCFMAASISGSGSMAVTVHPSVAKTTASWPGPQPRSRTRDPARRPQRSCTKEMRGAGYGTRSPSVIRDGGPESSRLETGGHCALGMIISG